jgi:hypothetical protein
LIKEDNLDFCTHFSSNYIPQGLALISSVKKHYPVSKIWVMPLDEMTRFTLTTLNIENVSLLNRSEDQELFANFDCFQLTRSFAESVFSIKPQVIECVMKKSQENETIFYMDADTFMFAPLKFSVSSDKQSIFLSPHYFTPMSIKSLNSGEYNAGLVGFRNNDYGRLSIRHWISLCKEWCFVVPDAGRYADQKYLEEISKKWKQEVEILEYGNNFGPWSFANNLRVESRNQDIYINGKKLVSFHFHGLRIGRMVIRSGVSMYGDFSSKNKFKTLVYTKYISAIEDAFQNLSRIGLLESIRDERLIPKTRGLRNFFALLYRKDYMFTMSSRHLFGKKK